MQHKCDTMRYEMSRQVIGSRRRQRGSGRMLIGLVLPLIIFRFTLTSGKDDSTQAANDSTLQRESWRVEQAIPLGARFDSLTFDSVAADSGQVVRYLQTASGSIDRSHDVYIHGMKWTVAVRGDSDRVVYLATEDGRFVTPEGIHVGSTISDAMKAADDDLGCEPGFLCYVILPSGWRAVASSFPAESDTPMDTATVWFLFKRE